MRIDLATNTVSRVYHFDEAFLPAGAILGHLRTDGRFAYVTESHHDCCFIVVDLESVTPVLMMRAATGGDAPSGDVRGGKSEPAASAIGPLPDELPPDLLAPVDLDWLDAALAGHPGLIRLVTLAPEADPDHAGTRLLVDRGVVVALGHSTCTFEAAIEAARAGARLVTHLGNGSSLCALEDGRSVATTTTFTPLDGLPMATRSGSMPRRRTSAASRSGWRQPSCAITA